MDPVAVTHESILGYGKLVSDVQGGPAYDCASFSFTADVHTFDDCGSVTVCLLDGKRREMNVDRLERHTGTTELLVQLQNDCVLFLAKPSETTPAGSEVKTFLLKQGQALVLDRGTWHWIPFPVDENCRTLVVFKAKTPKLDYEVRALG